MFILNFPSISQIKSIPVYVLHNANNEKLPFLIGLAMQDEQGKLILLPCVAKAINRTLEITGRTGLITQTIMLEEYIKQVIHRSVPQAIALTNAVLLYSCQNAQVAENLIAQLLGMYRITLLKDFFI